MVWSPPPPPPTTPPTTVHPQQKTGAQGQRWQVQRQHSWNSLNLSGKVQICRTFKASSNELTSFNSSFKVPFCPPFVRNERLDFFWSFARKFTAFIYITYGISFLKSDTKAKGQLVNSKICLYGVVLTRQIIESILLLLEVVRMRSRFWLWNSVWNMSRSGHKIELNSNRLSDDEMIIKYELFFLLPIS